MKGVEGREGREAEGKQEEENMEIWGKGEQRISKSRMIIGFV